MPPLSRRSFLRICSATGAAIALGPSEWGWAQAGSPFALQQDDPLIMLPEGYSYQIIARTGDVLDAGRGPFARPPFPDLNIVWPRTDGKLLLSTSHEVPEQLPLEPQPPEEEYDPFASGAVTTLLLNPDLTIEQGAYNAGGMINNCSGGATPWGTVLTGEEATMSYGAEHGFVWEVDIDKHTKTRLDDCGKFEHEAAKVHRRTGYVYLTEDSGTDSLLYRMRPEVPKQLSRGGVLEAYKEDGTWVTIDDPTVKNGVETGQQGVDKGAVKFARLEGTRFDGRWMYFTETEDETACGKIWRLNMRTMRLELFAEGKGDGDDQLCMPDNIAFDGAGNLFVCEDREIGPNRVMYVDRKTGKIALFATLAQPYDEPTGLVFAPTHKVMFLNLMRNHDFGVTLAIKGPFSARNDAARSIPAVAPAANRSVEETFLSSHDLKLSMPLAAAAALLSMRRRGRIDELDGILEEAAVEMGTPDPVPVPKKRRPKSF